MWHVYCLHFEKSIVVRTDVVILTLYVVGVAYPGVRDNRSTINTKTGYDKDVLLY